MAEGILTPPEGEQIKLVINKMTEEQYQELATLSADYLSTELSNQLFLTLGNGGGDGIPPLAYKTYEDTKSSLSNEGYVISSGSYISKT